MWIDWNTKSLSRRWNVSISTQANPVDRLPSLIRGTSNGSSLLSLKAYYLKLRTFKGTVKTLINLRRVSSPKTVGNATTLSHSDVPHEQARAAAMVVRLSSDTTALQTMQNQIQHLVQTGHVVTKLDPLSNEEISYQKQGNLEHYTETNLKKRLVLQNVPHIIALTQRLWLSIPRTDEEKLYFQEYEGYMLRLHRLILPEFNVTASKKLIRDDWDRDTNGSAYLNYRRFHLSMFELVDLWTDSVDAADYVSLLYCMMHHLTFAWRDKHVLKPLEDINPIDILDKSQSFTKEHIENDLEPELKGADAKLYHNRLSMSDPPTDESGSTDLHESSIFIQALNSPSDDKTSTVMQNGADNRRRSFQSRLGSAHASSRSNSNTRRRKSLSVDYTNAKVSNAADHFDENDFLSSSSQVHTKNVTSKVHESTPSRKEPMPGIAVSDNVFINMVSRPSFIMKGASNGSNSRTASTTDRVNSRENIVIHGTSAALHLDQARLPGILSGENSHTKSQRPVTAPDNRVSGTSWNHYESNRVGLSSIPVYSETADRTLSSEKETRRHTTLDLDSFRHGSSGPPRTLSATYKRPRLPSNMDVAATTIPSSDARIANNLSDSTHTPPFSSEIMVVSGRGTSPSRFNRMLNAIDGRTWVPQSAQQDMAFASLGTASLLRTDRTTTFSVANSSTSPLGASRRMTIAIANNSNGNVGGKNSSLPSAASSSHSPLLRQMLMDKLRFRSRTKPKIVPLPADQNQLRVQSFTIGPRKSM